MAAPTISSEPGKQRSGSREECVTFPVTGMTCAACQSFVERTLNAHPGVKNAFVNLMLHNANVIFDSSQVSAETLVEAVRETGYGAELRRPLGIAIVGGLLLSQVLTLYTTPVIYLYMDRFQSWYRRAFRHKDSKSL